GLRHRGDVAGQPVAGAVLAAEVALAGDEPGRAHRLEGGIQAGATGLEVHVTGPGAEGSTGHRGAPCAPRGRGRLGVWTASQVASKLSPTENPLRSMNRCARVSGATTVVVRAFIAPPGRARH